MMCLREMTKIYLPHQFRELLGLHLSQMREKKATYLFESCRRRKYSDRGIRKMLARLSSGYHDRHLCSFSCFYPLLCGW